MKIFYTCSILSILVHYQLTKFVILLKMRENNDIIQNCLNMFIKNNVYNIMFIYCSKYIIKCIYLQGNSIINILKSTLSAYQCILLLWIQ